MNPSNHLLISVLFSLFLVTTGFGQSPQKEWAKYTKELEHRLLSHSPYSTLFADLADSLHQKGNHFYKTNYDTAALFWREALDIRRLVLAPTDSKIANSCFNLGKYAASQTNFRHAIELQQEAIFIRQSSQTDSAKMELSYMEIGLAYKALGDYDMAFEQFQQGLQLANFRRDTINQAAIWQELAILYNDQKLAQKAIFCGEKALIFYTYLSDTEGITDCSNNLGIAYDEQKNYLSAIKYYKQAVAGNQVLGDKRKLAFALNNLGVTYRKMRDFKKAEHYLTAYKRLCSVLYPISNTREAAEALAAYYDNMGDVWTDKKNYLRALESYHIALQSLCSDSLGLYGVPKAKTFFASEMVLRELHAKARTLTHLASDSSNNHNLEIALAHYQVADTLIDQMRREQLAQNSKLYWRDKVKPIYRDAVFTAFKRYKNASNPSFYAEKAFYFIEKSKAVILTDAINERNAKTISQIPDSLLAKEYALKQDIARWQEHPKSPEQASKIQQKQTELYGFIRYLEAEYPLYYQYKYDFGTASVLDVQQTLIADKETTWISFADYDSLIYSIVIRPNTIDFYAINAPTDSLWQLFLSEMRSRKMGFDKNAIHQYLQNAHHFYEAILAPLGGLSSRLWIAADGRIAQLPIEALVCELPNSTDNLQSTIWTNDKYAVSYAYSATLLLSTPSNHSDGNWLGVAPKTFGDNLPPLPASEQEIMESKNLMNGTILVGKEATKAAFLTATRQAQILHLATHAYADSTASEQSWIAFSDKYWKLHEIYATPLTAEMVVLSACETGNGALQQGEGVISLARGFALGGVPSTVTTLWTADDQTAYWMTTAFYAGLKKGLPKDKALQAAKKKVIEKGNAAPYFWASWVLIGNRDPIIFSQSNYMQWFLPALLLGMLIIFSLKFRQ